MTSTDLSKHDCPSTPKNKLTRRVLIVLLIALAVATVAVAVVISRLGSWLMVSDPLEKARAIVVMGGHLPLNALEAADLYRQGYASEVWVTRPRRPAQQAALAKFGVEIAGEESYNVEVLKKLGVPQAAIRVLEEPVRNTATELRAVARELGQLGGDQVIVVTAKTHTRRAKHIWQAIIGDQPRVMMRWTAADPFEPRGWWRRSDDAQQVLEETVAMVNLWLGEPILSGSR